MARRISRPLVFGHTERSAGVDEVVVLRLADLPGSSVARRLAAEALFEAYGNRVLKFAQLVSPDSCSAEDLGGRQCPLVERLTHGLLSKRETRSPINVSR